MVAGAGFEPATFGFTAFLLAAAASAALACHGSCITDACKSLDDETGMSCMSIQLVGQPPCCDSWDRSDPGPPGGPPEINPKLADVLDQRVPHCAVDRTKDLERITPEPRSLANITWQQLYEKVRQTPGAHLITPYGAAWGGQIGIIAPPTWGRLKALYHDPDRRATPCSTAPIRPVPSNRRSTRFRAQTRLETEVGARVLGRLNRPWLWGFLHLGAIPAFALVYQQLHRPLYHATARFEPAVRQESRMLAENPGAELRARRRLRSADVAAHAGAWKILVDQISINSLRRASSHTIPLDQNSHCGPYVQFVLDVPAVATSGLVLAVCSADLELIILGPSGSELAVCMAQVRMNAFSPPSAGLRLIASPVLRATGDSIIGSIVGSSALGARLTTAVLEGVPPQRVLRRCLRQVDETAEQRR